MAPRQRKEHDILDELKEHLCNVYSESDVHAIFEGFSTKRHTTLRVNTLKIDQESFEKIASTIQVVLESVPWYNNAYVLVSPTLQEFSTTQLYQDGLCYVQSFSSMLPPLILNPKPEEKVLDLCAAPGSKTSQMAMMMQNLGEIVANDVSHTRMYRLKANLEKLGVNNTTTIRSVGQGLWHEYHEYFDKTLVDVPCSMEGRIYLYDVKTYKDWSIKKTKELQEKQKFLLRSGISATKPGGVIVYSTCTLSIEENEEVLDWILKKENGNVELEEFDIPAVPWSSAILTNKHKTFLKEISKTKRILPSEMFEGFYIAKLKKLIQ